MSGLILRSSCHTSTFERLLSCVCPLISFSFKELDLKKTLMASLLSGSSRGFSCYYLIFRSSCHNLCTWMASLLCGSSHVSSSCLLVRISSYAWIIGIAFLLCGSSLIFKWSDFEKLSSHLKQLKGFSTVWVCTLMLLQWTWSLKNFATLCATNTSLPCGFPHVPSSGQLLRSSCLTSNMCQPSLLCGSSHVPSRTLILKT